MEIKMVSVVERVWKQALQTFTKNSAVSSSFEDNFTRLKSLADGVSANDVQLDSCLLEWTTNCPPKNMMKPPVTYIEIFEDDCVTIGIFILRSGARIPLHDHPQMHGILKVLTGTVKVQSYNVLTEDKQDKIRKSCSFGKHVIIAEKLPEVCVNENSNSCTLSPVEGNLHEIYSVDGPAAFMDILAPPYDSTFSSTGERSCHYFKEVSLHEKYRLKYKNIVALFPIPSPPEFWSDSAPYTGPELR